MFRPMWRRASRQPGGGITATTCGALTAGCGLPNDPDSTSPFPEHTRMTHACRNARSPRTAMLAVWLSACLLLPACAVPVKPVAQKWVATWGQAMTSQVARVAGRDGKPERDAWGQPVERAPTVDHLTLRQSVNLSAGGERVRIRLSNYYGRTPLTVSAARIA